jgi:putative Mg2+ transporter-C (MgtC) family protein
MDQVPVTDQLLLLAHVAWAMVLGALMGWERQLLHKPAGLRTHILVAGASALITGVTVTVAQTVAVGDPTRGIHGILTGIGFLGAGAIIQQGVGGPSGLTTAATIMYSAVIGAAVAAGYGVTATVATVIGLMVLRFLGRFGRNTVAG